MLSQREFRNLEEREGVEALTIAEFPEGMTISHLTSQLPVLNVTRLSEVSEKVVKDGYLQLSFSYTKVY